MQKQTNDPNRPVENTARLKYLLSMQKKTKNLRCIEKGVLKTKQSIMRQPFSIRSCIFWRQKHTGCSKIKIEKLLDD
jgi:hypothetical protein